jgi:hypothetical protein
VVESIPMEIERGTLPPPPGLVASMVSGFDSVANHIGIILPPILLDLFLWLGPHLRYPDLFPAVTTQPEWVNVINQSNWFLILRTFPVGVTSLLGGQLTDTPAQTPWGSPFSLTLNAPLVLFGWFVALSLLGWLIGALYYYWVCNVVVRPAARSLWKSVKQSVSLSLIWLAITFFFGLPALLVALGMSTISPFIGQVLLFIGALLVIWLLMPVFFSAHGIFTLQMDAMRAILNSMRMVRFTMPTTGLFLLVFVIINQGLNFLWSTPEQNSWFMLVGIAGHAFISTALLAASFIYYRDINAWLVIVFEQLQRQTGSAKA